MIGLIDVALAYQDGVEKVTLAFYSSSGTNNGKIKGLWYPIVGIKRYTGPFIEFTPYINDVLSRTTQGGGARKGWLAKSLFFCGELQDTQQLRGFTNGLYYTSLLQIGEHLRTWYEEGEYTQVDTLNAQKLNKILTSQTIYKGNKRSQQENFEKWISDIVTGH